jgi:TPR repeat protein
MTKPFAQCLLLDLILEIYLSSAARAEVAVDAAAAAQLLPRLADGEATEAALQRHPLVRGANGLVCTGTAESERAWCSMLRDLLSASGAAVSDDDLRRVYLVCRQCCTRGHVRACGFIARTLAHPAIPYAGGELLAQLTAHPVRCLASQLNVQRWRTMLRFRTHSPAHAPHWHVTCIDIRFQQRMSLLCRVALCAVLVPRLLCVQDQHGVVYPFNLAQRIASRLHFLGSNKSEAEGLFQEGQRLYGEQRFGEAAERWGRAALLQHGPSHAHVSSMRFDGRPGVLKDEKQAFQFASAGAALGCAHSKGALGRCYVYGRGVAVDETRGLALGRESDAAGSCFGQFLVGKCYDEGLCVDQDDAEAVRLYRLAALQGNAAAMVNLAVMVENGEGVEQDYAEAVRLYRLASAQGDAFAQYNLGLMFEKGEVVARDTEEALRWFRLAAAQGDADAQIDLGCMFKNGEGVEQDYAEAVRLWRLAAAQGCASAQYNLGLMFEKGEGVAQDTEEALLWFRLAAAQGDADAVANLKRLGA